MRETADAQMMGSTLPIPELHVAQDRVARRTVIIVKDRRDRKQPF